MTPLAESLLAAYDRGLPHAPPTLAHPGFDLRAAYALAAEIIDARQARGERRVGRKIGFTNRGIWPIYGVHGPIWGAVWDSTFVQLDTAESRVSLAGLVEPRLEPEIVLGLRAAPRSSSLADLADAVGWIAHGFEVVQSLAPGWKFAAADTVAAFGLHARLLVGPRVPVETLLPAGSPRQALADRLSALSLTLSLDGRPVAHGRGADALDGPLQALGFLVDTLAGQPDLPPLAAGEVVTTGTLTDAQPMAPGQAWTTTLDGNAPLAGLSLRVEA